MPSNLKLSTGTVNTQADALARRLDNGYLRIYDGAQPATANSPVTTQKLLAELRIASPSSSAAVNGVIALTLHPDTDANDTGQATWYRMLASDGVTPLLDGSAGTDPSDDLVFDSASIQIHSQLAISGYQHTVPKT